MGSFSQHNIQRMYQVWARTYEWLTPLYLLGNEGRLRRKVIRAMNLEPGQTVIDIACGTRRNFPWILNKIGPAGTLVGVDYTPAMLERARERVSHEGWENVHLVQGNAARISIDQQFDAALCTLAMSVIPDYWSALKVMVNHVRHGGRVAIAESKLSTNWYVGFFN